MTRLEELTNAAIWDSSKAYPGIDEVSLAKLMESLLPLKAMKSARADENVVLVLERYADLIKGTNKVDHKRVARFFREVVHKRTRAPVSPPRPGLPPLDSDEAIERRIELAMVGNRLGGEDRRALGLAWERRGWSDPKNEYGLEINDPLRKTYKVWNWLVQLGLLDRRINSRWEGSRRIRWTEYTITDAGAELFSTLPRPKD